MMDWFFGLDWRIRLAIPVILAIANVAIFFAGYVVVWLLIINAITFMFCGRSHAEKNGYHH